MVKKLVISQPKQQLFLAIFFSCISLALLLPGARHIGVSWDEAYPNLYDAKREAEWIKLLFTNPGQALQPETIDSFWQTTSHHPTLFKTFMALAYLAFNSLTNMLFAMRLPNILLFSSMIGIAYYWCANNFSPLHGFLTVFLLLTTPRLIGHSHFACLDTPITVMCFLTVLAFLSALKRGTKAAFFCGLVFSSAVLAKLHSFFLPLPLIFWSYLYARKKSEKTFLFMIILPPIFYYLCQPLLWYHPWQTLLERFGGYTSKCIVDPIAVYYLGRPYTVKAPLHYPLVLILFTTPLIFLLGLGGVILKFIKQKINKNLLLMFFCAVLFIILPILPGAQPYDGVRLILPCFPFLAVLAASGLEFILLFITQKIAILNKNKIYQYLLIILLFFSSIRQIYTIFPWYLCYYNGLVGGVDGAYKLGMETTYWCETLDRDFLRQINREVFPKAKLMPLAMSMDVLSFYQALGWLRSDIIIDQGPPYDYHLLQHRQGMFGHIEEYFIKKKVPLAQKSLGRVPLMSLYGGF